LGRRQGPKRFTLRLVTLSNVNERMAAARAIAQLLDAESRALKAACEASYDNDPATPLQLALVVLSDATADELAPLLEAAFLDGPVPAARSARRALSALSGSPSGGRLALRLLRAAGGEGERCARLAAALAARLALQATAAASALAVEPAEAAAAAEALLLAARAAGRTVLGAAAADALMQLGGCLAESEACGAALQRAAPALQAALELLAEWKGGSLRAAALREASAQARAVAGGSARALQRLWAAYAPLAQLEPGCDGAAAARRWAAALGAAQRAAGPRAASAQLHALTALALVLGREPPPPPAAAAAARQPLLAALASGGGGARGCALAAAALRAQLLPPAGGWSAAADGALCALLPALGAGAGGAAAAALAGALAAAQPGGAALRQLAELNDPGQAGPTCEALRCALRAGAAAPQRGRLRLRPPLARLLPARLTALLPLPAARDAAGALIAQLAEEDALPALLAAAGARAAAERAAAAAALTAWLAAAPPADSLPPLLRALAAADGGGDGGARAEEACRGALRRWAEGLADSDWPAALEALDARLRAAPDCAPLLRCAAALGAAAGHSAAAAAAAVALARRALARPRRRRLAARLRPLLLLRALPRAAWEHGPCQPLLYGEGGEASDGESEGGSEDESEDDDGQGCAAEEGASDGGAPLCALLLRRSASAREAPEARRLCCELLGELLPAQVAPRLLARAAAALGAPPESAAAWRAPPPAAHLPRLRACLAALCALLAAQGAAALQPPLQARLLALASVALGWAPAAGAAGEQALRTQAGCCEALALALLAQAAPPATAALPPLLALLCGAAPGLPWLPAPLAAEALPCARALAANALMLAASRAEGAARERLARAALPALLAEMRCAPPDAAAAAMQCVFVLAHRGGCAAAPHARAAAARAVEALDAGADAPPGARLAALKLLSALLAGEEEVARELVPQLPRLLAAVRGAATLDAEGEVRELAEKLLSCLGGA